MEFALSQLLVSCKFFSSSHLWSWHGCLLQITPEYMLAVVKIAGQQFTVKAGDSLYVPHIAGKTGDKVEFSEVLLTGDGGNVAAGSAVKAVVKAEILSELVKGDKVIAFKMKRRKGFRKKHGHRTQYTQIKVTEIA